MGLSTGLLHKKRTKKKSIREARQGIQEHLNRNIFTPLTYYQLHPTHDYPWNLLTLKYDLTNFRDNPDYDEAKTHWKKDLPRSVNDPEELEYSIRVFNEDIATIRQQLPQFASEIGWGQLSTSYTEGDTPPINHVSIPNIITKLQRDWIEKQNTKNFETYKETTKLFSLEGLIIAHVDLHLVNHLKDKIEALRNHYTIKQNISSIEQRRTAFLQENERLNKEIKSRIISRIERKQYTTKCKDCDDDAISPTL